MINLRIAITGSTGFIGSYITNSAKNQFAEFFALNRSNILSFDYSKVDTVVHLAAIAHTKGVKKDDYYSVNKDLAVSVAKLAKEKGVKHFVFISSVKVYGNESDYSKPITISDIPYPKDDYGQSKLEAEKEIQNLEDENFTVSIIRPPLVYGPGVKANMLFIMKLIRNFPVLPFGKINNKRSFIFVGNLVAFLVEVIKRRESGVFIVDDGILTGTSELIQMISNSLGKKIWLVKIPLMDRIIKHLLPSVYGKLWRDFAFDTKELYLKLHFIPPYTKQQGITEMVKWYLKK